MSNPESPMAVTTSDQNNDGLGHVTTATTAQSGYLPSRYENILIHTFFFLFYIMHYSLFIILYLIVFLLLTDILNIH